MAELITGLDADRLRANLAEVRDEIAAAARRAGRVPDDVEVIAAGKYVAPGELPNWGETFAGATIATVPILLLFVFLQRYFVRGIASSGMKG